MAAKKKDQASSEENSLPVEEAAPVDEDAIDESIQDNIDMSMTDPIKGLEFLKQSLAYIEIKIEDSFFQLTEMPIVHEPDALTDNPNQKEFVYKIFDYGDRLISSKAVESLFTGQSMIKMFYTIDKMIAILYEKIKQKEEETGETREEIKIYLDGFELCLRKAFEVIINLPENWVVLNYDPGEWGNRYLEILQKLFDRGYAYPPPAPRDYYRLSQGGTMNKSPNKK